MASDALNRAPSNHPLNQTDLHCTADEFRRRRRGEPSTLDAVGSCHLAKTYDTLRRTL